MKGTLLVFAVIVWSVVSVSAQNGDEYFHQGANLYIEKHLNEARRSVELGLQLYPENPKLQALLEKMNEEQEKQQDQQDQEQNENKDQQDQEKEGQQDQQQEEQEQNQENQKGQSQENPSDQNQQDESGQQSTPEAGELTQEEAERLLEAMQQQEAQAHRYRRIRPVGKGYTGNEW